MLPTIRGFRELEDELQGVVQRAAETLKLDLELRSGNGPEIDLSRRTEVCGGHAETRLLLWEEAGWGWTVGSAQVDLSES